MKKKSDYICPCYKITKEDFKNYIKQGLSYKEIQKETNIGKKCSSCKEKTKKKYKKYKSKLSTS